MPLSYLGLRVFIGDSEGSTGPILLPDPFMPSGDGLDRGFRLD